MKFGKQSIHDLPLNDITSLGVIAQQVQQEAEARGETLPPPVRLHIGEPSFRTPEHINQAAIQTLQSETLTYGPASGWPWLREQLAAKIERVNGYSVGPEHTAIAMGGTGAIQAALTATVGVGDEVLIPDPHCRSIACSSPVVTLLSCPIHLIHTTNGILILRIWKG